MRSAAGEGGGWSSRSLHVKTDSRQEEVLAILIAFEIVLFSITGRNFLSLDNFFEGVRLSAEIGLLALALTPVLITDGIDLSVESMMGFCAVGFGAMWRDAHLPIGIALLLTMAQGLLGGALNAALIACLDVSPLIVTLGTYSLFRRLAEGITGGARSYSGFPDCWARILRRCFTHPNDHFCTGDRGVLASVEPEHYRTGIICNRPLGRGNTLRVSSRGPKTGSGVSSLGLSAGIAAIVTISALRRTPSKKLSKERKFRPVMLNKTIDAIRIASTSSCL